MISRVTIALVGIASIATLAACASPQAQRVERERRAATAFLERQGSIGDPGRVAAADIAFAKMAREQGQWTAFLEYAAPDALIHGRNGVIPAQPWLAQQDNPSVSVAWTPNTVWSSCDGTLAVSFGRFQEPDGKVGSYVTTWELQSDNSYKYTYDLGALDDPQPVRQPQEELPEGAIIVPGMTAIEGRVADCPAAGIDQPAMPVATSAGNASGTTTSKDGTLQWTWSHADNGERRVIVTWLREGEVREALNFAVPAEG
ncbi:hypothetical protein [Aurantiacibacter rhizosphaerae]|uniref:Lipoprotein n=1 Tax=Aurantiacibacter rhizosphaerae TaxID=2691582 RepID=A0A844XA12_9SPHN|nr:hypothetical protein [Aurantiacibacter rhizosphaerae]MWV26643.1 hypothetical protein [Aurantiacibacter rhizosphaerae]